MKLEKELKDRILKWQKELPILIRQDDKLMTVISNVKAKPQGNNISKQYQGIIYWIHIDFKEKIHEYDGLNIMPYRFSEEEMNNAHKNDKKFNEHDDKWINYDATNYHKKPDGNVQYVFTKGSTGSCLDRNCYKDSSCTIDDYQIIIEELKRILMN